MKTKFFTILILNFLAVSLFATEILFHRGEPSMAPDNTIESFQKAWESGAKYVEADFWYSYSGEFFVYHTAHDLKWKWGWQGDQKRTRSILKEDLQKLRIIEPKWKDIYPDVKIPNAEQVIATIPPNGVLYIDCKDPAYGNDESLMYFTNRIEAWRIKYNLKREQFIFCTSAVHGNLIKKHYPGYRVAWGITIKEENGKIAFNPKEHAKFCKENNIDIYAIGHWIHKNLDLITPKYIRAIKKSGVKFAIWTENDPALIKKWIDMGVDMICTDKGAEFVKELENIKKQK